MRLTKPRLHQLTVKPVELAADAVTSFVVPLASPLAAFVEVIMRYGGVDYMIYPTRESLPRVPAGAGFGFTSFKFKNVGDADGALYAHLVDEDTDQELFFGVAPYVPVGVTAVDTVPNSLTEVVFTMPNKDWRLRLEVWH